MDIWKTFFTEIESVISKISLIVKIVKLLQAGSKIKFYQNCSIFKFTRSIIKLERFSGSILLKNAAYTSAVICFASVKYTYLI